MRIMKEYKGRKVIFTTTYGSTNYGTRTPESDNDYKVFLMPTFEDLYQGKMFSEKTKLDGDDYEFHDVRKLAQLFYKSNPAYLEILSAKETVVNEGYDDFYEWIISNRERIAKMNLKGYHNALVGMAKQKLTAIVKDLPNSDENEGYKRRMKFGFDTKQLMHIFRLMAMRIATFEQNVSPLDCVYLDKEHPVVGRPFKEALIDIKSNASNFKKEDAIRIGKKLIEKEIDCDLDKFGIDELVNTELINKIMQLVKKEFEEGSK